MGWCHWEELVRTVIGHWGELEKDVREGDRMNFFSPLQANNLPGNE